MKPRFCALISTLCLLTVVLAVKLEVKSSDCTQEILDTSFVTRCGPRSCEPALDRDGQGKREAEWPSNGDQVVQIVSSRESDRFKVITHRAMDTFDHYFEESHVNGTIFVDTEVKYQRILGFGTTLTDASCKNVDDLSEEMRDTLIKDYFSPEQGIGLNLIKIPIGSSKYSYTNYVLDQPDTDQVELSPYDVDQRIPIIREAMSVAGKLRNRVKLLASSATAPAEMKSNNKMVHGGYLNENKFNDYAAYLTGFIAAYKAQGLTIWSLILSESPVYVSRFKDGNDTLDYNTMAMRPSDSAKLIRAINQARAQKPDLDRFRLLLLGDTKANIPVWSDAILSRGELAGSVAGVAYKCDGPKRFSSYDNLVYLTKRYTNKYLLATQSSPNSPMSLGSWQYAENYATEIVKNLEFGAVGWIDFNMALNLQGGPTISEKFKSDAAVIIDPKTGNYYRNPMFYAIGHLSRYVKPGSIRVKVSFPAAPHTYAHQLIAFVTPDNYLVVFVSNNNINPMPVSIGYNKRTKVESLLATKSFNTFIIRIT